MSLRIESPPDHRCRDSSFSSSQFLFYPFSAILPQPSWVSRLLFFFFPSFFDLSFHILPSWTWLTASSQPPYLLHQQLTPPPLLFLVSFVSRTHRWDYVIHTSAYSTNCSVKNGEAIVRKYYYESSFARTISWDCNSSAWRDRKYLSDLCATNNKKRKSDH